ncbi:MAG: hypothetical protein NZ889_00260 [Candidatus Pacearchaeota archaeon]|nr:hypothetical protein [Candidatus Pacearchaeota archaeon]
MQKKAQLSESLIWLYRFIMIIIIIGLLLFGIIRHNSLEYDVRPLEASLLANKLVACIEKNTLNESKIKECITLDQEIFLEISINKENKSEKNLSLGRQELKTYCEMKEKQIKMKHFPHCFNDNYLFFENETEKILSLHLAILKTEKNV